MNDILTMKRFKLATQDRLPLFAILLSFVYWAYLYFTTSMVIAHDAICYYDIANDIFEKGWIYFFKTGPQREPFYPFIIATSMKISEFCQLPYESIQKILQIGILFISQLLMWNIFQKMNISPRMIAAGLLYFGFSPCIVNSAFSLYSEILTYPFTLGIIIVSILAWRLIQEKALIKSILMGMALSALFLGLTGTKGVGEGIFVFFMIPFF
jgi:hypothetical protein